MKESRSHSSHYDDRDKRQANPRDYVNHLEEQLASSQQEIARLSTKNDELMIGNERLEKDLRRLQEISFSNLEDAHWMPPNTSSIKAELIGIRDAIWSLAKSYAAESLEDIKEWPNDAQLAFRSSLDLVVRFEQHKSKAVHELIAIKHAPRLLLAALISHRVHDDILANAFFFLDDGLREHLEAIEQSEQSERIEVLRSRRNGSDVLASIYKRAEKYEPNSANKWRSDTIRLINPKNLESSDARSMSNITQEAVKNVAHDFARALNQDLATARLRQMGGSTCEALLKELTQICVQAGRLSIVLWSQRPAIAIRHLSELAQKQFHVASKILQAHPLHVLDDPDDHTLDGRLTKILVHPAVIALGNHEADQYDHEEVWAKAVVWLDVGMADTKVSGEKRGTPE